eukprot:4703805-Prymnesium_polylepis.1
MKLAARPYIMRPLRSFASPICSITPTRKGSRASCSHVALCSSVWTPKQRRAWVEPIASTHEMGGEMAGTLSRQPGSTMCEMRGASRRDGVRPALQPLGCMQKLVSSQR